MDIRDEPHGAAARRGDGRTFDLVIGAFVVLISLVSLFVAMSANRTQERMLAASVWPSLLFSTGNANQQNAPMIVIDLLNRGTGPARVRWAELSYEREPVADWEDLLRRCCTRTPAELEATVSYTSGVQNRVLGVDEWVHMLQLMPDDAPQAVYDALNQARHRITLRACYCSVLDDCWVFDSMREDPQPVRQCPAAPAVRWRG